MTYKRILKREKILFLCFFLLLIASIINSVFSTSVDLFVLLFEVIPIACVIISIIKRYYKDSDALYDIIMWAAILQAILSILAYLFLPIQMYFVQTMITNGYGEILDNLARTRCFGLSRSLTFTMPIVQSVVAGGCIYNALSKNKLMYLLPVPFLVFSSMINARTGLLAFVLIVSVIVLTTKFSRKTSLFSVFIVVVAFLLLANAYKGYIASNSNTADWINSGVEEVFTFVENRGENADGYFSYMTDKNKYQLPSDMITLLFGSGTRAQGSGTKYASDVGFINDIWMGGVIYCLLITLFFVKRTYQVIPRICESRLHLILGVGSAVIILIMNIKGQIFSWNEFVILWMLVYCYEKNIWKVKG